MSQRKGAFKSEAFYWNAGTTAIIMIIVKAALRNTESKVTALDIRLMLTNYKQKPEEKRESNDANY